MNLSTQQPLIKPLTVWACVIAAIHLLMRFQHVHPYLYEAAGALTAVLLIYPPALISFYERKTLSYWQLNGKIIRNDLKWFGIFSLSIFPLVTLGNHFYQKIFFAASFGAKGEMLWFSYGITQIVLVAFPEEFFFRGYLQTALKEKLPSNASLFGVPFGRAQVVTCALFAISHSLIFVQWWHAFIFFPALGFAWLREKTGTIWAATLFHASCNVFSYWVARHYG